MTTGRIQSRIDAVTVYRDGARVRRVSDLDSTDSGYPSSICLTGLPLVMQDASVRVSVEAVSQDSAMQAVPVASDVRVTLDVPGASPDLAAPVEAELEEARIEVRRVSGRVAQVKRELARMERLIIAPRPRSRKERGASQPPPESPTSARIALLSFREERERALRNELASLETELGDAERTAKKLEARHRRATTARQAREHELRKALVISLHSENSDMAPRARLVVEYLVPGARWSPAYAIRLGPGEQQQGDQQGDKASFAMRALVAQQTGEDWSGVALTLSTADAQSWVDLPELTSMRIGRRQTRPAKTGWRPAPSGTTELYRDYDREYDGKHDFKPASGAAPADEFSPWEDKTREITMPSRRMGGEPVGHLEASEFEEVTGQYDSIPAKAMDDLAPPAPPPPPSPAPVSRAAPGGAAMFSIQAQSAPRRRAQGRKEKKRARGGGLEEARAMPAAPPSMTLAGGVPSEILSDAPYDTDEGGAGGFEVEQAITASTELLAYGNLRMLPPTSPRRGTLQPTERMDLYMELLVAQRVEISFNVLAVLGAAARRARDVLRTDLPSRYRLVSSDRYDYAYASETVIDVPSDGAFHSIALMTRSASVKLGYVVVPRESTDVFRLAEVANPLDAPILDGPVDVYLDKEFLLTSDVEFTPPGGKLLLGLGVEQAVKVSRNTAYREESSGLIRGSLLLKHEIRVEVQNHLGRAIECEVRERIPATRKDEDDITVTVDRVSPAWAPYEPELATSPEAGLEGGYRWQVQVEGKGGRRALEADYSIKIPAKYELAGGNRRES